MSNRFDELSKALSTARSRRSMLKLIAGTVAGAVLSTARVGGTPTASADIITNGSCPPQYTPCYGFGVNSSSGFTCCPPGYFCVGEPFEFNRSCMPAAQGVQFCQQVCNNGPTVNGTNFFNFNSCMSQCLGVPYPFI